MLHLERGSSSPMGRGRDTGTGSRSTSVGGGRRSGEIIEEENEDEIEEVEVFSPIVAGAGVHIEETILESSGIEDGARRRDWDL